MRFLTGTLAVLMATAGVAHAGYPVVVDREGTMQQVQQLSAQLAAIDQQIYALRPRNPRAIDQLRVQLQQAMQQAQQLDQQLRQAPAAPVAVVAPPPPAYPPPQDRPGNGWGNRDRDERRRGPMVVDEGQFNEIARAVEAEAFSQGKINVLTDAIGRYLFTVDQVKRVIGLFAFSADKLRALELTAPRIADRQNNFKIYEAFTFSADKEKARQILSR